MILAAGLYPAPFLSALFRTVRRIHQTRSARASVPNMTPMAIPALSPPVRPPPPPLLCSPVGCSGVGAPGSPGAGFGLPPYGQKSPPSGGRIQVNPSPLLTFMKPAWIVDVRTVFWSMMNDAGPGVASVVLQFGPRAPMNVVLPIRVLFSTVKLTAEVIAMA